MKRLIDDELVPDSGQRWLAELVRATPPLAPAPLLHQKVLAHVKGGARMGRAWIAKPAALVATFGVAGAAAAAVHGGWLRTPAPSASVVAVAVPPAAWVPPPSSTASESASVPAVPAVPAVADRAPERSAVRPSRRAEAKLAARSGEDPALVLEAIRALRNRGDGARAGGLLAEYLKTHPTGVLVEDATALSIEAALARHDESAARELARRYLAQFPTGRFRSFATQAAKGSP